MAEESRNRETESLRFCAPFAMATSVLNRPLLALLVDRDAESRRLYAEVLRMSQCITEEAADGREALAKAIARQPDVIVSETRLPGISGIDLCRLLRGDTQTRGIPIIFVTADSLEDDLRHAEAAGADAVLVKPCLPERLTAAIEQAVARSPLLRRRTEPLTGELTQQMNRSNQLVAKASVTRRVLSRVFERHETTTPPAAAPAIVCPRCDRSLRYLNSFIGGVSERYREQWDMYECSAGCGRFQYRQRTRKLRRIW
jgi:two-component system, OmpR family, phosphate regulon response regulator PhoB